MLINKPMDINIIYVGNVLIMVWNQAAVKYDETEQLVQVKTDVTVHEQVKENKSYVITCVCEGWYIPHEWWKQGD